MKYVKQFGIILLVSCIGETLRWYLPFAIPTTIYGLVLMLFFLKTGIIKLESVLDTGEFLTGIMPVLFIPSTVGIIASWEQLQSIFVPIITMSIVSTFVVMIVSGKVTDFMMRKEKEDESTVC
ncbi:MAG: CidA/LrgA family protein [Eubacteriales bacterium]